MGLDLKDDLCRFQIIIKVPYPYLGDRWINEKRRINGQWYIWQTALRLVQGYGKSIRSKADYAVTYVLDSGFEKFVCRMHKVDKMDEMKVALEQILRTVELVLHYQSPAHDFQHILRVYRNAGKISKKEEGADLDIVLARCPIA